MADKKDIYDTNIIGTQDTPVQVIYVRRIIGCENISYDPPIIPDSPETETFQGMEINTTTNDFEFKTTTSHDANINLKTYYLNGNGTNAGLRFPGGGVNGEFTNQLTVKGQINADRTGGHSLVAAESIRVELSYYTGENQGVTSATPYVADIRWNGATLEYRPGTINVTGGIITLLQSLPVWIPVP